MQLKHLLARLPPPLRSLSILSSAGYDRPEATTARLGEPGPEEQRIPERFVHDIWVSRLFDASRLQTTDGQSVSVLDSGRLNSDAGPDFLNARVRIGELDWRGDVEIHFRSSDWIAHQHQFDPRYNSVVLHVSFIEDFWTGRLNRPDGSPMPEIILRPALAIPLRRLLLNLNAQEERRLPCAHRWNTVPEDLKRGWINRVSVERLREKQSLLAGRLSAAGSLEELLYRELMRGMGYSKNADAFLDLACRVPLALLRQASDAARREAILFGVAGLLSPDPKSKVPNVDVDDTYRRELRDAFESINSRLRIPQMSPLSFQFFRLRPVNFPTLRIAQVAGWFSCNGLLERQSIQRLVMATQSKNPTRSLRALMTSSPSTYWTTHLRFARTTQVAGHRLGMGRIDALINNTILPLLMLVAEQRCDRALAQAVVRISETLPAESTSVTRIFSSVGFKSGSASDTQGLHHLYRTRCTKSGCLSCPIGRHLLRTEIDQPEPGREHG